MKCPKCSFDNPDNTHYCGICAAPLRRGDSEYQTATFPSYLYSLTPGSTFMGRYQIIEELGEGGMGKVYKTLDKEIGERVAIKLLRPEIAAKKSEVERFRNELKMARKISHRNVCRMYDLNDAENALYITMEYVEGEDLKNWIRMMGPLTVAKTVSIAKQVCLGLGEAHRQGIIHRDLKPRNIMIDHLGNARIMDFGVAASRETKGITDSGAVVGTPTYMSPEQAEGKDVDLRSDIYALGVILYEMVTGRVPFQGDTALSVALKHRSDTPISTTELNTNVPEDLNRLILKCLEKDRSKRYPNTNEIVKDLKVIEQDFPSTEKFVPDIKTRTTTFISNVRSYKVPVYWIIVLFMAAGALFIILQNLKDEPPAAAVAGPDWQSSIAVMIFKDLSPEQDLARWCEGLTEDINAYLSLIQGLKVISSREVRRFLASEKTAMEIGKELGAEMILDGSLQKDRDKLRIAYNLIDTQDGSVLDSKTFLEDFQRILEVQGQIANDIEDRMKFRLEDERIQAFREQREPKKVETKEFYNRGLFYTEKYLQRGDIEDFLDAEKNLKTALKIEPDYVMAYCRLGYLYEQYNIKERDEKYLELMRQNYETAYRINPDLAESNVGLGWYYLYIQDNDKAYEFLKRAFILNPNNYDINYNIGGFLRSIGLYNKAIKYYNNAIALKPSDIQPVFMRTRCLGYLGRHEMALNSLQEVLQLEPGNLEQRLYKARLLLPMQRYQEAENEISAVERLAPDMEDIRFTRAWLYAAYGEREKALALVEGLDPVYFTYLLSNVYCLLGMKEKALNTIEYGIDNGVSVLKTYLYAYPYLVNNRDFYLLRDEDRYQEILKKRERLHQDFLKKFGDL